MKQNSILIAILAFPIILLLLWTLSFQSKISKSETVRIATTGYDPRDLLSGHYINLRLLWDETDCSQFYDNECPDDGFDYRYRFYVPEHDAVCLDRKIASSRDLKIELEFAMPYNSEPIITNLYIESHPWKEWLVKEGACGNKE